MFTSGILLAAGSSARMGADKLQLAYKGQSLFERALTPLVESAAIDEVLVVTRPDFVGTMNHAKCRSVVNADHREGLGASLRIGAGAASGAADAFVVALADMPEITADVVSAVVGAFYEGGKRMLVPTFEGHNGHPVVFAADCRGELLQLSGDIGARRLIRAHPELVQYWPTAERGVVHDVDCPEDLALREMAFADAGLLRRAAAQLKRAGVYFEVVRERPAAIRYYAFDEAAIRAAGAGGDQESA
jgi:molybdenum cofactor cytidylyltransferase